MSLVLSTARSLNVVLKDSRRQSVVLYDEKLKQLILIRNNLKQDEEVHDYLDYTVNDGTEFCTQCGQPLRHHSRSHRNRYGDDSYYFKLLENKNQMESEEEDSSTIPDILGIPSSAFSNGYFKKFFTVKQILGKGGRGIVFLVEHFLDGNSLGLYALKKVMVGNNNLWLRKGLHEVQIVNNKSEYLVNYKHVWLEMDKGMGRFGPVIPCLFILMEYCEGGNLEDYVLNSKRDLTNHQIVNIFQDAIRGVDILHENKIIHRDLKPSNLLLLKNSGLHYRHRRNENKILIGDFGESQFEGKKRSGTGSTGTVEYLAPELIIEDEVQSNLPESSEFSRASDVYSLGLILYFLAYKCLPGSTLTSAVRRNERLPKKIQGLMDKMLSIEPEFRPSTQEILVTLNEVELELHTKARYKLQFNSKLMILLRTVLLFYVQYVTFNHRRNLLPTVFMNFLFILVGVECLALLVRKDNSAVTNSYMILSIINNAGIIALLYLWHLSNQTY